MHEKKKHMMETAMTLFSEKGFHSTTIQEIAQKSGVSKGAFYLHFKSKEDLTLQIFKHYYQNVMNQINIAKQNSTDPTESLAKQIEVFLISLVENKEFIIMHMRENISLGSEVDHFIQYIKNENFKWNSENLFAIYGEKLKPYIVDATSLLEGIINGYLQWMIIDNVTVNTTRLSHYISRRVDDCIQGLLKENEEPQIKPTQVMKHMPDQTQITNEQLKETFLSMKDKISLLHISESQQRDLNTAIDVLIEEVSHNEPRPVIIKGMLSHFADISEMNDPYQFVLKKLDK
ncbi:TetR/AcrR family transcriptional regulator [Aquibacillus salsiterrae]|uniref:TetR/AcrR family transcriptional regulator n=1 Tax=Aquibacillus salsiterrae TaxID=2950439 RepID=A0A9X3WAV2_9BACI|nr:TetR/AcrR family transcriptional regulator [Aquibacillus salsiterrae]MDC3415970.1 TetR/AcrR family transcriptional regulator [Aquibacillus salsiterrae]